MSEKVVYPAPPTLGPGDNAGPLKVRQDTPAEASKATKTVYPAPVPAGPGDGDGDAFEGVALPPLGPGDLDVPRPVIRVPRKRSQLNEE